MTVMMWIWCQVVGLAFLGFDFGWRKGGCADARKYRGFLRYFKWKHQKIWVKKKRKDYIHLFKNLKNFLGIWWLLWDSQQLLLGKRGNRCSKWPFSPSIVDAPFDAARPIQDKSSCHRARDFTKVCCSGHESDSWTNGFFFYIVQLQWEIVIAAVLPLPASPRLLSANSLSFCSTSKYSHRTPKKALSLSWASHTGESIPSWAHWKIRSWCCDFFHTFRLVPVAGGSSWGWSWSRWAHAGREFGSCQSLIAQDSLSLWIKAIQGS